MIRLASTLLPGALSLSLLLNGVPLLQAASLSSISPAANHPLVTAISQNNNQSRAAVHPSATDTALNLALPIEGSTITGSEVTATFYSTGDLSLAHHVIIQLDDRPAVTSTELIGIYTFTNVSAGSHQLLVSLAKSDGTPIPGTASSVNFTTTTGSGPSTGVLPSPQLNLPAYAPVDGTLSASYPPGFGNVKFSWTITLETPLPGASSSNGSANGVSGKASSASFPSTSNVVGLKNSALAPGYYRVSVQAIDGEGNTSIPQQGFVTLVTASLQGFRIYPNPWRADRHATADITFDRMPLGSTVKIYTVSGHWVKTLTTTADTAIWNRTNDNGDKVASGIYLYLIKANNDKTTGQIHIIK